MTDDDYWPVRCSGTERVKGRPGMLQECVPARQGLYLQNKLLAIIQQPLLLHHKMAMTKRSEV